MEVKSQSRSFFLIITIFSAILIASAVQGVHYAPAPNPPSLTSPGIFMQYFSIGPDDGDFINTDYINVTFEYSGTYISECSARVDSSAWQTMSGTYGIQGLVSYEFLELSDGEHIFNVKCKDSDNVVLFDETTTITIDTEDPLIYMHLGEQRTESSSYGRENQIWAELVNSEGLKSSDKNPDYCEINFDVDGSGSYESIGFDYFRKRYDVSSYSDGEFRTVFRCFDKAGNNETVEDTIFIDRVRPSSSYTVTSGTINANGWANENITVTLNFEDSEPSSGEKFVKYNIYSLDDKQFYTAFEPVLLDSEGEWNIRFYARDNADNSQDVSESYSVFSVNIDKTQPTIEINEPTSSADLQSNHVKISGIANDVLSGIDFVEIKIVKSIDDAVVLDWTEVIGKEAWEYIWNVPENSEYKINARVHDVAGNVENATEVIFTLQNVRYMIEELEDDIEAIEIEIDTINGGIEDMNITINDHEDRIQILEGEMEVHDSSITELMQNISAHQDEIDALGEQIGTLEDGVGNLEDADVLLQDQITSLENQTLLIQGQIEALQEADVLLQDQITVHETEITNLQNLIVEHENRLNELEAESEFQNERITELEELTEEHTAEIDDLKVRVSSNEDSISEIRDDVEFLVKEIERLDAEDQNIKNTISALTTRVSSLEASVLDLQLHVNEMVDFNLEFDQVDMELSLSGNGASTLANFASILVYTVDGQMEANVKNVAVNADGTFEYTFNVSEWRNEVMNIYVKIYEHENEVGFLKTVYDVWGDLVNERDYGFNTQSERSWATFYMNHEIGRDITYSILPNVNGPQEDEFDAGLYTVRLTQIESDNFLNISQVIENCTWLDADVENSLTSTVLLSAPGKYMVVLEAEKGCTLEGFETPFDDVVEVIQSNPFVIELVDLKTEMDEAVLNLASPEPNVDDVFWTNANTLFDLTAVIDLNSQEPDSTGESYCDIVNLRDANGVISLRNGLRLVSSDITMCSGKFSMSQLNNEERLGDEYLFPNEAIYEFQVELDMTGIDPANTVKIGVDNTEPVIGTIYPGEENEVSGTLIFSANVTDALSGVETVDMILTLKNETSTWKNQAEYNLETKLWEVRVDTTLMPDGYYDITVIAYDFAGNMEEKTIDPVIDNSAPEIIILEQSSTDYVYEGDDLYVKFQVNEVGFAGLDYTSTKITFDGINLACETTEVSRDLFQGTFETVNCTLPFTGGVDVDANFKVTIEASDLATPSNDAQLDFNLAIVDSIVDFVTNDSCVEVEGILQNNQNGEVTTLTNNCNEDRIVNMTVGIFEGIEVPLELVVKANSSRYIYTTDEYLASPETATVSSLSYDASAQSLITSADGEGTQEVIVYTGEMVDPLYVYVDNGQINNWTYQSNFVKANVEYGSEHDLKVLWKRVSTSSGGGSSSRSSSTCNEDWQCNEYSACYAAGFRTRSCVDLNECGTELDKPTTSESCDYDGLLALERTSPEPAPFCGDGICQGTEDYNNCADDCEAPIVSTSSQDEEAVDANAETTQDEESLNGITGAVVGGGNSNTKGIIAGVLALFAILGIIFVVSFKKAR